MNKENIELIESLKMERKFINAIKHDILLSIMSLNHGKYIDIHNKLQRVVEKQLGSIIKDIDKQINNHD